MNSSDTSYSSFVEVGGGGATLPIWIVVMINILLGFFTVVGNFMVILAYIRDEEIRGTVAHTIILNLSITDILVGIFIFPLNTLWWINDRWAYGLIPCKLWLVLDYSVLSMSTLTIVYISLDRYWLLNMGFDYQRFQTTRKVLIVLGIGWVITVLVYLFIAFIYPVIFLHKTKFYSGECELEVVKSQWFNIFEMIVKFIIPFSALVFFNCNVYNNVRKRARGLERLKHGVPDGSGIHSHQYCHDENGTMPVTREISTTDMVTKQPSDGIEIQEGQMEKKNEDIISTHSLCVVSIENNGVTTMTTDDGLPRPAFEVTTVTTDGESSRPTSAATEMVLKTVNYYPLPAPKPPTGASTEDIRLAPTTKHEAPVEKKRRKSHHRQENTEFKRYRRAAITLAALVTVFCICWLPYYICAIIGSICKSCIGYKTWEVVSYFQWCNSTINPFIYGFTNLLFRRNFVKFLRIEKCLKKKHLGSGQC